MPISISLPAPSIEWISRYFGPLSGGAAFANAHGQAVAGPLSVVGPWNYTGIRPVISRNSFLNVANGVASQLLQGYGTVGAGTNLRIGSRLGRFCSWDVSTNPGVSGTMMCPIDWLPDLRGSPAAVPGFQDDAGLVGVFDFHMSTDIVGAPAWANDAVGFYFMPFFAVTPTIPSGGGMDIRQVIGVGGTGIPGDPFDIGGFGIFFNGDGAGATVLEYVSWSTGSPGVVLERIRPSAAVVPNAQNWNSVRFVIIGARPGFGATLTVQVNGVDILPVRAFGSAQLAEPSVSVINSAGMAVGFNIGGPAPFGNVFSQWHIKLGRFTPGGAQVQPA